MAPQPDSTAVHEVEVVVLGGGPTGLCAADVLGRSEVSTVLVERRARTSTHPRVHLENCRVPTTIAGQGFRAVQDPTVRKVQRVQFQEDLAMLGGLRSAVLDGSVGIRTCPDERTVP